MYTTGGPFCCQKHPPHLSQAEADTSQVNGWFYGTAYNGNFFFKKCRCSLFGRQ